MPVRGIAPGLESSLEETVGRRRGGGCPRVSHQAAGSLVRPPHSEGAATSRVDAVSDSARAGLPRLRDGPTIRSDGWVPSKKSASRRPARKLSSVPVRGRAPEGPLEFDSWGGGKAKAAVSIMVPGGLGALGSCRAAVGRVAKPARHAAPTHGVALTTIVITAQKRPEK